MAKSIVRVIHHLRFLNPVILPLHMSSSIAKFVECSREESLQANTQPKSDVCHTVEYSSEKNMFDVIFSGSIESHMKFV